MELIRIIQKDLTTFLFQINLNLLPSLPPGWNLVKLQNNKYVYTNNTLVFLHFLRSLNKRLFIIKSGIVSVLNETQNMYGGLSVNPALQGLKKITKAEVQFTDPRLTRSLKHFLLYFYTLLKFYVL